MATNVADATLPWQLSVAAGQSTALGELAYIREHATSLSGNQRFLEAVACSLERDYLATSAIWRDIHVHDNDARESAFLQGLLEEINAIVLANLTLIRWALRQVRGALDALRAMPSGEALVAEAAPAVAELEPQADAPAQPQAEAAPIGAPGWWPPSIELPGPFADGELPSVEVNESDGELPAHEENDLDGELPSVVVENDWDDELPSVVVALSAPGSPTDVPREDSEGGESFSRSPSPTSTLFSNPDTIIPLGDASSDNDLPTYEQVMDSAAPSTVPGESIFDRKVVVDEPWVPEALEHIWGKKSGTRRRMVGSVRDFHDALIQHVRDCDRDVRAVERRWSLGVPSFARSSRSGRSWMDRSRSRDDGRRRYG